MSQHTGHHTRTRPLDLLSFALVALIVSTTFFTAPDDVRAQEADAAASAKQIKAVLGGDKRYVTHLSTDKPVYRPGETLYLRAATLNAFDRSPIDRAGSARVQVIAPGGETLFTNSIYCEDAVLGTSWEIPKELAGGEYTIKVNHPHLGDSIAERKFDIRAFRAPRLKTQIEFVRKGYGPGDRASASMSVERAEGGIPSAATVTAIARIDGEEVWRGPASIDSDGNCGVAFDLPKEISIGQGTLTFVIEDGGVVESASKTIPILAQSIDLAAYPEGGDLVVGLESRLYIEAITPWGDPADISALIVDQDGEVAGAVDTNHEGRGVASFTPEAKKAYTLKVVKPESVKTTLRLPPVKVEGAVLRSNKPAFDAYAPIELSVAANKTGKYRVAVFEREDEVSGAIFALEAGVTQKIMLTPPASADGVLRATVFEEDGTPLAERLIYRMPSEALNINIRTAKQRYLPGDVVEVEVTTTDSNGKPVEAVVGITVTDDAVLEMIETREQAPRLPAMAFLEAEVKNLEDAQIYLDGSKEGDEALDLLLGTQGWRRFAYQNANTFIDAYGDQAKRALAYCKAPLPQPVTGRARGIGGGGGWGADGADRAKGEADEDAGKAPDPVDAVPAENAGKEGGEPADPRNKPKPGNRQADKQADNKAEVEEAKKQRAPEPAGNPAPEPEADAPADEEMEREDRRAREVARRPQRDELERMRKQVVQVLKPIRVYAHMVRASRKQGDRRDFAETLYWAAGLKTNEFGKAHFSFGLSDAVTSFRVMADGFTSSGAIGSTDALIESRQPFYVEAKLPLEVTQGDRIDVPVSIVNGTPAQLAWQVEPESDGAIELAVPVTKNPFVGQMSADERARTIIPFNVRSGSGESSLTFSGSAGPFNDSVTRTIKVVPSGFPISQSIGGMLEADSSATWKINVPEEVVSNSMSTSVNVYPTPLANMTGALEALIREPYGCFEQTSSTTYPLIMAQQYFKSHVGVDPALISRANTMLEKGYKRLISYECKQGGFEWFGGDPAHEALTAYGVLEFIDMAQVYDVDKDMLSRSRNWLLSRRDGEGGFLRNSRALDSFGGAPKNITDAYIVWSLTEAGEIGLNTEIDALVELTTESKDPYLMGLVAGSLYNVGRNDEALSLAKRMLEHQQDDGCVIDAKTSITRSGGEALKIETTSISVLVWLDDPQFTENVESAMQWLTSTCKDGRFGSTQSTVLALKAITAYDASRATPKADGEVIVKLNGNQVATIGFTKDEQGQITLPDLSQHLTPGNHQLELSMKGGSRMPYSLALNYNSPLPFSAEECEIRVSTTLSNPEMVEGEGSEVMVSVKNLAKAGQGMTTAIIGLPGGLEPRVEQLKELVEMGTIDFFELRGREVICYWRDMAPEQEVAFKIDVVAAIPGEYTGPASRAYLYYTDEYKHWVEGIKVKISAR